ncbi:EIF4B [Bugula neritina]|uniref:EIF4B n=1 Tax=Bugula neritina TaxID=10212 RepID=A0A7J7JKR0_BUGNE|nr:EIF4B [Bugula neritina]
MADAMEDADDDDDFLGPTERIALPTAPRAARQEIDLSQIPDVPPYKAYVGNLSYDVDEDALENFFKDLRVNNVRLVRENGRMKGFGYVEFDDKNSLIDALKSTGQTLMARKIKVDLATQSNSRDGFGGGYGGDREGRSGNSQISGEGDADDDWRGSAAANKPSFDSGYGRHGDRDGGRYGGRRGYDERDGGFGAPRDRYGGGSEADTASSWSRGPPRSSADSSSSGYGSRRGQDNERIWQEDTTIDGGMMIGGGTMTGVDMAVGEGMMIETVTVPGEVMTTKTLVTEDEMDLHQEGMLLF